MKLVWITGGSTGIGLATAKEFLDNNWKVAVSSRNNDKLLDAKKKLLKDSSNHELHLYQCDISKKNEVQKTIEIITAELGNINLAILNAAAYSPNKTQDFAIENYEHLIDVNLKGTLYCINNLINKMKNRNGHIAIVSSPVGYRGLPTAGAYGMTKAG